MTGMERDALILLSQGRCPTKGQTEGHPADERNTLWPRTHLCRSHASLQTGTALLLPRHPSEGWGLRRSEDKVRARIALERSISGNGQKSGYGGISADLLTCAGVEAHGPERCSPIRCSMPYCDCVSLAIRLLLQLQLCPLRGRWLVTDSQPHCHATGFCRCSLAYVSRCQEEPLEIFLLRRCCCFCSFPYDLARLPI